MMPEWIDKAIAAGPAAIFALLWWLERDERKSAQVELKAVTRETLNALNETKAALATFSSMLSPRQ